MNLRTETELESGWRMSRGALACGPARDREGFPKAVPGPRFLSVGHGGHMSLMLFSDLHLDTPFRWAGPESGRARRNALRETLRTIVALAEAQHADALVCGGDLYEQERFSPDTASFLAQAFSEVDVPVYLAPGNPRRAPSSHWPSTAPRPSRAATRHHP